ncbi:MAG: DUF4215 domain-containing protein [Polyangiales bacterium]
MSATCNTDCTVPVCGDGIANAAAGEGCDDGNVDAGDGCNATCLVENGGVCTFDGGCESGNCSGGVCAAPCTSDDDCATGETCNTTTGACELPAGVCGDGTLNDGEGCDDNNTSAGDGCSASCLIENGSDCTASAACASGQCTDGVCVFSCTSDTQCDDGQTCDLTTNVCVGATATAGSGLSGGGFGCSMRAAEPTSWVVLLLMGGVALMAGRRTSRRRRHD